MRFTAMLGPRRLTTKVLGTTLATTVRVSDEVSSAVRAGRAVVALESTILSHGGLSYPRNLELAQEAESLIRKAGAVPATCAVIGGVPKVGLTLADLDLLSSSGSRWVTKASRRDLSLAVARGTHASTTVAGTMILAAQAGIHVFATGGIGGVHRGAECSFDVSADLMELGRTPVAVVCAGVKSILDIPKTLEVLETQGVPVIGLGTSTFPAFFVNSTGNPPISVPLRLDTTAEVAKAIHASLMLGLTNGMVVAVPNPQPHPDPAALEECIERALVSADSDGVKGADVTPYLLAKVEALTGGKSLQANIALYLNNVQVAAQLAVALADMRRGASQHHEVADTVASPPLPFPTSMPSPTSSRVVVVGGAARDIIARVAPGARYFPGSSNPGSATAAFGGVARNISVHLARELGGTAGQVALCSVVGGDADGTALLAHTATEGVDVSRVRVVPSPATTARYVAIHGPDGDLVGSVADMAILGSLDATHMQQTIAGSVRLSELVVADGNLSATALASLASICKSYSVPLFFEPTSDHKCLLPLVAGCVQAIDVLKPNASELVAMVRAILSGPYSEASLAISAEGNGSGHGDQQLMPYSHLIKSRTMVQRALDACSGTSVAPADADMADLRILAFTLLQVMSGVSFTTGDRLHTSEGKPRAVAHKHVIASLGPRGVLWASQADAFRPKNSGLGAASARGLTLSGDGLLGCVHIPSEPLPEGAVVVTNGGGDAFCAGFIGGMLKQGMGVEAVLAGHQAARRHILRTINTVQ